MSAPDFDTQKYWEQRLQTRLNLRGTGHKALSLENNAWLYQSQRDCMDRLVDRNGIEISGKSVLDIGCGTGFYVEYFQNRQAGQIFGIDITETSVQYLKRTFPTATFIAGDISSVEPPLRGQFNIVSAIGVLYHILNEARFQQALMNICQLLAPGGYLFISDSFHKPLLPSARHAYLRPLQAYQPYLTQHKIDILAVQPIYYFSNRIIIPGIGPWILNYFHLGKWLYNLDNSLRNLRLDNGSGVKLLLAQRRIIE